MFYGCSDGLMELGMAELGDVGALTPGYTNPYAMPYGTPAPAAVQPSFMSPTLSTWLPQPTVQQQPLIYRPTVSVTAPASSTSPGFWTMTDNEAAAAAGGAMRIAPLLVDAFRKKKKSTPLPPPLPPAPDYSAYTKYAVIGGAILVGIIGLSLLKSGGSDRNALKDKLFA
jgi:hypothetical protein